MAIKVVLDAGHGGSETGACANGYVEKDLNLKVVLFLEQELKRCGFEVILTRDSDTAIGVAERGYFAVNQGATCLISVHFNSFNGTAKGTEMIYSFGNESAKWIAQCMFDEATKLGMYKRGVWTKESDNYKSHNWYGVLRGAEPLPAVIAEGLFLDNIGDIEFLKQPDFLKKLAIAYCKGICIAYGIAYISETKVDSSVPQTTSTPAKSWDDLAMEYLVSKGFLKSQHEKNEVVTMAVFGQMMKNYFGE